jgi:ABC-2 type transport system ATP-binding protein
MSETTMKKRFVGMCLSLVLVGCGGGGNAPDSVVQPVVIAQDAPGHTNVIPPSPSAGQSRAGKIYAVYIRTPGTGDTVAFTVFEPATFDGGKKYPLILHSHGFTGDRATSTAPNNLDPANPAGFDFVSVNDFVSHGYGVISIAERAHGESNGSDRVLDPDAEGKDLLAVLDWAEAKLDWLAYGPSSDGRDPHNLIVGSVGESYGGFFQYLIHNIDPKHRLDAMVPKWAPYDLTYALSPYSVPKTMWDVGLFLVGNITGARTGAGFDPFVVQEFTNGISQNRLSPAFNDFLIYHSPRYFCEGQPVATNGGPGTQPERAPLRPNDRVNVLIEQGMRDTVFNLNEAYNNYSCLKAQGGDVRLLTHQIGHNSLLVVPDPGAALYQPPGDFLSNKCGTLDIDAATLAFFDEHLKGIHGAASKIPTQICLSIAGSDAVLVDQLTTGHSGTQATVPATTLIAGVPDVPVAADLGITADSQGDVVGGIPRLEVDVQPVTAGVPGEPIIFAGIGIQHSPPLPVYELLDNMITPLRGTGAHAVDLGGVAARLKPGEKVVLLLYGGHEQYLITGSTNLNLPTATVMPVTVSGKVWVPLLGPLPAAP